ncbi:MAG: hypothetical protein ACI3ZP_05110 [Candidatus Cryptobacteroides sp.]
MKREYYLVTSTALANNLLFRDKEDFQVAHNYLAICKLNVGLTLVAHCLMGNHFHLVVWSDPENLRKFLTAFKRRYSMWLHRKYGLRKYMSKIKIQLDLLPDSASTRRAIAYVLTNLQKANVNISPDGYEWCSANCYFNPRRSSGLRNVRNIGVKENRRLFKIRNRINDEVYVDQNGVIDYRSIISGALVEKIFGSYKSLNYHMSIVRNEADINHYGGVRNDSEIYEELLAKYGKQYGVDNLQDIPFEEKVGLIKVMRREYGSGPKQIARILGLSIDFITTY